MGVLLFGFFALFLVSMFLGNMGYAMITGAFAQGDDAAAIGFFTMALILLIILGIMGLKSLLRKFSAGS